MCKRYIAHYEMDSRLESSTGSAFEPEQIQHYAEALSGKKLNSNNLHDYLKHHAVGLREKPPQHVFLIVSESYANWPLLSKYENLHITDGVKAIINRSDSDYLGCRCCLMG